MVGRPDPEWGQVVTAVIVVAAGHEAPTLDEVRDAVRAVLPAFAAPRADRAGRPPAAHRAGQGPAGGGVSMRTEVRLLALPLVESLDAAHGTSGGGTRLLTVVRLTDGDDHRVG